MTEELDRWQSKMPYGIFISGEVCVGQKTGQKPAVMHEHPQQRPLKLAAGSESRSNLFKIKEETKIMYGTPKNLHEAALRLQKEKNLDYFAALSLAMIEWPKLYNEWLNPWKQNVA